LLKSWTNDGLQNASAMPRNGKSKTLPAMAMKFRRFMFPPRSAR
jgi:hypothetical protein